MEEVRGSTSGPQRRVARRKRSLTNQTTIASVAAKKPKEENTQLCNGTVRNPSPAGSVNLAGSHPLHIQGVFASDESDGHQKDGHSNRQDVKTCRTSAKSCSQSGIGEIQHKKPLFQKKSSSQSTGCRSGIILLSKSQGDGCKGSRGRTRGALLEPASPVIWPVEDNDDEYWMLGAEVDSQKTSSCSSPLGHQQKAECETSPSCSPLPPTPQGPRLKNTKLLASARLHEPPCTTSETSPAQNSSFSEWDKEDSFYSRLDIEKLIADSEHVKDVDTGAVVLSGGRSVADGSLEEASREENVKCSVTRNPVLTSSVMRAPEPLPGDFLKQPVQSQHCNTTSDTPNPEKWFSYIENLKGSIPKKNPASLLEPRADSNLKKSRGRSPNNDVSSTCSNTEAPPCQIDSLFLEKSTHPLMSTPKVTSAGSRLRQRLLGNARVKTTPQQSRLSELRQAKVQEAATELLQETSAVPDNDIGPFYGLPSRVAGLLKSNRGIDKLYDWQHACLTLPAIREGRNLIYSLPTSGGKTLVAEILIMRQLLCNRKDALLILPFVSIVQEKVASLSTFAVELGFLVEEYAGSRGAIPPRKRRKKKTLYIATIERAHSLVNSLILEGRIESLGLVVVDELHMLGDGGRRGASLEACITKLLHLNSAHIIGMSATLSNIQDLCFFMRAEVYCSDFRPVELKEYIKIEDNVFEINQAALCPDDRFTHSRTLTFPYTRSMRQNDPDHLVGLALEVIPDNSCLVFCATKRSCQNVAEFICKHMPKKEARSLMLHKHQDKQVLLLSLRRECDNHLCPTLKRTVPYGLAYHHSGLTMDERKLIEDAYSEGTLCLLTCTSTLAAGVNLPAKRVILRSPYIAQDLLTSTRYKQMVGRAGRAGIDSSGESILIIKPSQRREIAELLSRPIEACYSSLTHDGGKGLRSLILSLIALKLTPHLDAVLGFMNRTLFGVQAPGQGNDVYALTLEGFQQLQELDLVNERRQHQSQNASSEMELIVTKLGQAAFKGSIDIDLCASIYGDLKQACDEGLVLANSLHLLYLVTPYDLVSSSNPNWVIYDRLHSKLSEGDLHVSELIGVTDRYLHFKVAGRKFNKVDEAADFRVRRFYLTLMLWSILNQTGVWDVAAKFEIPRGFVQNLLTSAASFGSSVQRFCEDLPEFWAYQQLLTKVVHDLTFCSTADLVSLLEVPGVKQGRAKQLVRAGYKTLRHLAHADPSQLTKEVEHLPKKTAQQIVAAAKMELAERAEALREEAEELVTKPSTDQNPIITTETGNKNPSITTTTTDMVTSTEQPG